MNKYRIYALIHGQVIREGKIFECEIKHMDFDEQTKRGFAPIQSIFSENEMTAYHKTYVTSLPYIDPIRIKSGYVIICEIEEDKPGSALGGAIRIIDRVVRFLSLANLEDVKRTHGRNRGSFEPYVYQVNKIYQLDENGDEKDAEYKLESGHIYLPDRPEKTDWRNSDINQFLEEIYNLHNETLERSLKYLYRSSIGYFVLDSHEKIALDHFKSIEIIINSLSKKQKFKQRLAEAAKLIEITPEESKTIERFWNERSTYGDIAHPSLFDEVERYPNQFPVPSNARYSGASFDSIAPSIILKYYFYIRSIFNIDINTPSGVEGRSKEGDLDEIYEISMWGPTHHNHLIYYTTEKNKKKLVSDIKETFASKYKIPATSIIEAIILPGKSELFGERRVKLRICTTI